MHLRNNTMNFENIKSPTNESNKKPCKIINYVERIIDYPLKNVENRLSTSTKAREHRLCE